MKKIINLLKVKDINHKLLRIGSKYDGGYVVSDPVSKKTDTLISFGAEDNIDFELHFLKKFKPKDVHLFDKSFSKIKSNKKIKFYKKKISYKKTKNTETLNNILKKINSKNITLKMDIEFSEWKILEIIDEKDLKFFDQILIEFHLFLVDLPYEFNSLTRYFKKYTKQNIHTINQEILINMYYKVLKKILKYFYLFHLSPNNSLKIKKFNNVEYPQLLELSFVNKKFINKVKNLNKKYPIKNLDYPNKYYKSDVSFKY